MACYKVSLDLDSHTMTIEWDSKFYTPEAGTWLFEQSDITDLLSDLMPGQEMEARARAMLDDTIDKARRDGTLFRRLDGRWDVSPSVRSTGEFSTGTLN